MGKSFISILVFLISVSLLGLIAIQIFWIRNSIALRDAQFRRNVKMALTELNHSLEQEEKMHRLRMHDFRRLFLQYDSLRAHVRDEQRQSVQMLQADSTRSMHSTTAFSFKYQNPAGASPHGAPKQAYILPQLVPVVEEDPKPAFSLSEEQMREIVGLILDLSSADRAVSFSDRYGAAAFDSLLSTTLSEIGGIHTDYRFGIFDAANQPLIISDEDFAFRSAIVSQGYHIRLLPADVVMPPTYLHIWFPNQDTYLLRTLWPLLCSSALFVIVIIMAFAFSIRTILRQKKIADIRNDFINNMTHELKTPISTISLACEALSDPGMPVAKGRREQYVGMIQDENKRLGVLVESVLKSVVLDKSEMEMSRDQLDMHQIIRDAIRNIELQAVKKEGQIVADFQAEHFHVRGDKIHLTNVIFNLLDNAIKYSPQRPLIRVTTACSAEQVKIAVSDNGIGIRKEEQRRVFDKLYRVSTGNVHDIKGFGLGLSYVKAVMEKHSGTVTVKSEYGKGSTFTLILPLYYERQA